MGLLSFLGISGVGPEPERSAPETETVRKIVAGLEGLDPDRARLVAAFAFILSRVAQADLEISEAETRAMERLVIERMGLAEAEAVLAVQIAKTQARFFGGTENFLVTREFDRMATREQKLALLDCLFALSATDEGISNVESNEVRKIATELKFEHREFIAARSHYRDHLTVLKRPDGEGDPAT